MRRAAALAALLVLAACTGSSHSGAEPAPARAATDVLKDALIQTAVKAALVADDPDSTAAVGVSVAGGVATLRGVVKDAKTRDRLVADARTTDGVKGVVDALRIDATAPRLKDQAGDVALAARVQTALVAELGGVQVSVHVERGIATLEGTTANAKTKAAALSAARNTAGIRNVVDRIRVAGP